MPNKNKPVYVYGDSYERKTPAGKAQVGDYIYVHFIHSITHMRDGALYKIINIISASPLSKTIDIRFRKIGDNGQEFTQTMRKSTLLSLVDIHNKEIVR